MLYDEPTSALDPIMTDKINKLILSMREKLKMTSIVITHDIGSAYEIADKIAMIREGKIIFNGTPGEIRQSRNPYVQEFIRGERKSHYALDNEDAYADQVDINKLKQRVTRPGPKTRPPDIPQADEPVGDQGGAAERKFQMPAAARPQSPNQPSVNANRFVPPGRRQQL